MSLERLPKWGMIVDGVLYPLHALEHCISDSGGSYWLTPTTMDHLPVRQGEALENALYRGDPQKKSKRKCSGRLNEQVAYPQMWPTPIARDATRNKGGSPSDFRRHTPNLPTAILKMVATPTTSQANKPIRHPSPSRDSKQHGDDLQDSIGRLNPESIGKRLCPRWVSVLMGYPTTWTDLDPSVMQWYQSKQEKRSKS